MNFANEIQDPPDEAIIQNNEDITTVPVHVIQTQPSAEADIRQVSRNSSVSEYSRSTGAVPKKTHDIRHSSVQKISKPQEPDQIARIVDIHQQGSRILIILRGVSGSGKTYLAKHIVNLIMGNLPLRYAKFIFSTDDFFKRGGLYKFNKYQLEEAHMVNQKKVCEAANHGVSPIIVDNTNTEIWEIEPYVRDGVRNGYIIEIIEPRTPWARNVNQLTRRNTHGVPRESIQRMLDRYDRRITPDYLLKTLKLSYPANKKPPVKRTYPPIVEPPEKTDLTMLNTLEYDITCTDACESKGDIVHHKSPASPDEQLQKMSINEDSTSEKNLAEPTFLNEQQKLQKIIEAQKKFEQIQKIESEWENGESWDAGKTHVAPASDTSLDLNPKPPRELEKNNENPIESYTLCDDWTKISMFMPPWEDNNKPSTSAAINIPRQINTNSASTCFEIGDLSTNAYKILYGNSRDINICKDAPTKIKIPQAIMLDKSTSTHENDIQTDTKDCKYKENHFSAFRRMFKIVPRIILRDIFDSCNGDVNWAVNIVLDSYPESQGHIGSNEEVSDSEEEPIEECSCLAVYNIIPDNVPAAAVSIPETISESLTITTPLSQKKIKREVKMSDNSLEIKKQIESNVIISDSHYSQHYLNLRRRREYNITNDDNNASGSGTLVKTEVPEVDSTRIDLLDTDNATALPESYAYNNSNDIRDILRPNPSHYHLKFIDPDDSDTESDSNKSENLEKIVPVNVGPEFLTQLDELFGREGFQYPDNIQPVINLPMSILRQINAHWAMSVASQMDDGSKQTENMIKQDEEFARQLAAKEQEMSKEGKEPDVPTLKEIMDMELAYSIYERNVAEWRNNEPQDLAARLSREKLYNLFPDLTKDILSEMLMAHEYSFKATIESLLISTGQANWLEDEKGVEKYVMQKELQRKEKFLEEQNKTLSEVEWPFLPGSDKPVNLETVNFYRSEAQKYLQFRNANFDKAKQYFLSNSPYAASFYSDIASLHTKKYEQSSCLAAAYLMNYHLMNNPDQDVLDLHYLRVAEAMVNLDIFLDQVIFRLREKNIKYKETWIITGKGNNSKGGPRIKPATKRRLKARDIRSKEVNGGLLMAHLYPNLKMTNELAQLEAA